MIDHHAASHIMQSVHFAGYIDPGTGYVFQSSLSVALGFLLPVILPVLFFLRRKVVPFFKKPAGIFIIVCIIILIGSYVYLKQMKTTSPQTTSKMIILGFDGMDPKIIREGFAKNLYPNLKKLSENGYFNELETVTPPQSPVAWASFSTGTLPAKHGVFDFITRDPKTYKLDLSFSAKKHLLRTEPFWSYLSKHNISSTILFLPDTFPASPLTGKMLSGMGTPDIMGTQGTLTLFSSKDFSPDDNWRGKFIPVENKDTVLTGIPGPKYTFLGEQKIASIPVTIEVDRAQKRAKLTVRQKTYTVAEGDFSPWVPLTFSIDFFTKVNGMGRWYVKSVSPDIEIYLSPLNIDPEKPMEPVSYPDSYAKDIVKRTGLFATLGLPLDTWAFEQDIFDSRAFLKQADEVLAERERIYMSELGSMKGGLLLAYFGTTDTISHMFWSRTKDPGSSYAGIIERYYAKMDDIVGKTLKKMDKNSTLLILSDHGFGPFDYEMNVNTWLKENGYLVLTDGDGTGTQLLSNVDWARTKAYAIGYNGIYLNRRGREKNGIVSKDEGPRLEEEIKRKLLTLTNPETDALIVKAVYTRKELSIQENDMAAPDLTMGFYPGARTSFETVVGSAPKDIIKKRSSKWSGDHFFDISEVPAVLFSNKKITQPHPRIIDIMPTILRFFRVPVPSVVDGRNLIK